ncbi:MAG: ABC transporter ATP-binding protein [Chloroflexi bacterium]|nr:ABC transporter ATP-binding protein [Chloroflexota bacterium]
MTKLELIDITQSYREAGRKLLAIRDINLTVKNGEFLTIIGPSGSGKTTLLEVIAGLQQPDHGQVLIDGAVAHHRRGQMAYMLQQDALLPWRTVIDNVVLGPEIQGQGRRQAKQRARELLPLFGLEGFADSFPAQLSGGMRQRAAFLRTFLTERDILLLDEPFGALDALTRRDLQAWLLDVWQHFEHTVIFVTHDVEEAIYLSDRVIVLSPRPGQIVEAFDIPFGRPRHETVELFSPEMIALESELFHALKG